MRSVARLALAAGALSSLALLGWAAPAAAHASVVSASPAQGAHLGHAPRLVTVLFDQPVRPDNGGLVVLDSNGRQVQVSSSHPAPNAVQALLPASLGSGAYVSNYTVTSVDGHVVSGGVVFLVGHVLAGSIATLARPQTSATNGVDDAGQFLIYLGVLVAAGLAFFVAFVLREAPERDRLQRWTLAAAALALIGMAVAGGAQSVLTGGGIGSLAHWGIDKESFGGKFGEQCAAQLVGLAVCLASFRLRKVVWRQFAAFYGLLLAAGAFVLFGHAIVSPERWVSIPADVVHVVFAAMWAGGLVGLVVVLRSRYRAARLAGQMPPRRHDRAGGGQGTIGRVAEASYSRAGEAGVATALLERSPPATGGVEGHLGAAPGPEEGALLRSTSTVVGRFSTMAGISFAGIVVAGTVLAVTEVGSVANLFETGYGQLLLVKIAVVGLLLFVAGYNRYLLVPGLTSAADAPARREVLARGWLRLASTVRLEAIGMVAVLGVTALLANGTPSNGATAPPPVPFAQTQAFEGGHVSLRITPNQALVNNWTVQFTGSDGAPADLAQSVSIYLVLPSRGVGPIETDLKKAGVGRFVLVNSPNPPILGKWDIVLQVKVSEFSQPDVSFVDTVQ